MARRNLYSNAERRQFAISMYEDLSRFLGKKSELDGALDANNLAVALAKSFNSRVAFYDMRKALSMAVLGFSGLGSVYCAIIGAQVATMIFGFGAVFAAIGFVVSARKQVRIPDQFSHPEPFEWIGSDEAHSVLILYLEDLRSMAEIVYPDGSIVEDVVEKGWWYLAIAKSDLSDRSKEILKMDETTVPLVFRPDRGHLESPTPVHTARTPSHAREQDRNWLPDLSVAELHSLMDEFATFQISGKLQPWSRLLLERGKHFSDRHNIEDGRSFRREFLRHLNEEKVQHPSGRSYMAEDLAAVFCITNNSAPSACRRFLIDEGYRVSLRLEQSGNQHKLPLPEGISGRNP